MGLRVKRFVMDKRGTTFEGIALSVSILAVAFVAAADMLDFATKPKDIPNMMASTTTSPPSITSGNLDETPTASVGTSPLSALVTRSVLDPCTGKIR